VQALLVRAVQGNGKRIPQTAFCHPESTDYTDSPVQEQAVEETTNTPKGATTMPVKNPKELFVLLLSHVRQGTERSEEVFRELGEIAQHPEIAEALKARAFVTERTLEKLNEAFRLIGEKPVTLSGRLQDVFVEDFRKELAEIQSPEAKRLFVLATANRLIHLRIGEYVALVAAADVSGNYGVGVLVESCLADTLAFVERTRRLIRNIVETRVAARSA
jgi:ferritin-like metal-binding protein YciE